MSKIKLHNLKTDIEYKISVAAKGNIFLSDYSAPYVLNLSSVAIQSEDADIPTILWVVSIIVVVVMTVLTIAGVAVVVIKIRSLKHVKSGIEKDNNIY